jgi:hypothetical protein
MSIIHPTLIYASEHAYFGFRSPLTYTHAPWLGLGTRRPYTFPQLKRGINRGPMAWATWKADPALGIRRGAGNVRTGKVMHTPMPRYVSAYMALLDYKHYTHTLEVKDGSYWRPWIMGNRNGNYPDPHGWPIENYDLPINREQRKLVRAALVAKGQAFLVKHGLDEAAIEEYFNFDPDNNQYSARTVANDPVRWFMLQMGCGDHDMYRVVERDTPLTDDWY